MYPRTRELPKLLLPIAGRPFAHHLLRRLAHSGFDEVILCIGHLGFMIRDEIGDGSDFGLRVHYSDEGNQRLGTAGAIRAALPMLAPSFLVTYGDSYLPFVYAGPLDDLDANPEAEGTMAVYRNEDQWDDSNCEVTGELVVRYEKRKKDEPRDPKLNHIDYGAMALRREVILGLPEGASDLSALQRELAQKKQLRAYLADKRFYEIGSEAGYQELSALLAELEDIA